MHVCAVYTQRPEKDVDMLLYQSLPYFLETGNLTESAAIMEVSNPQRFPWFHTLCPSPRVIRATAVFPHGVWGMNSNHAHTARVLTTEQFPQPKFCFPDTEMNPYIFWILIFHPMYGLPIFSLSHELSLSLLSLAIQNFDIVHFSPILPILWEHV